MVVMAYKVLMDQLGTSGRDGTNGKDGNKRDKGEPGPQGPPGPRNGGVVITRWG